MHLTPFSSNNFKKLLSNSFIKTPLILASALAIGFTLGGCSDHDSHTETPSANSCGMEADTFSIGLQKTTAQQKFTVKLSGAAPAPPTKGDNSWTVQISDTASMPVDGATIKVTPFMPEHGHGSSIDVMVTPKGSGGEYTLSPINFSMPGVWETTIDITSATGTADSVKFAFCIEG